MKKTRLIAWILAAIAGLIIILAIVSLLTCKVIFGINHAVNYFHAANTFLLAAIALFIASKNCCCDCDCDDEKK
jgi:hypothetical protein